MANSELSRDAALAKLAEKYVWWEAEAEAGHPRERLVTQIMNFGTYEDIRSLEALFSKAELKTSMARAEPGWFSARSWEFWRGRLSLPRGDSQFARPPRRSFHGRPLRSPS